jgi:serine/threonine protein kinase
LEKAAGPIVHGPAQAKWPQIPDFRILGEIGRGGMGVVYEAVQESLDRPVALKVIGERASGDETLRSRFDREAKAAAKLHHTNIVPVFGRGEFQGLLYYAMQYIRGRGMDKILREIRRLGDAPVRVAIFRGSS